MGFFKLPPKDQPQRRLVAPGGPPKGVPRVQQAGADQVATSRDWKGSEASIGRMDGHIHSVAGEVFVDVRREAGTSQGVVSGLGKESTGTPMVATKDAHGNEILCRVEVDKYGREFLVPIEGGNKSDPIAGRCVAVYDPERRCEVLCHVVIGPVTGSEYFVEKGYRLIVDKFGRETIVKDV